jgi:hypothetical protein
MELGKTVVKTEIGLKTTRCAFSRFMKADNFLAGYQACCRSPLDTPPPADLVPLVMSSHHVTFSNNCKCNYNEWFYELVVMDTMTRN